MADLEPLRQRIRDWGAAVHEEAKRSMLDELDARVPVGSGSSRPAGTLRDSREVDDASGGDRFSSTITYPDDEANYTDEGTEAHPIEGNPLLAFEWNGTTVIVHSVQHPGTTGTRWWSDTITPDQWQRHLESAAASVGF